MYIISRDKWRMGEINCTAEAYCTCRFMTYQTLDLDNTIEKGGIIDFHEKSVWKGSLKIIERKTTYTLMEENDCYCNK